MGSVHHWVFSWGLVSGVPGGFSLQLWVLLGQTLGFCGLVPVGGMGSEQPDGFKRVH